MGGRYMRRVIGLSEGSKRILKGRPDIYNETRQQAVERMYSYRFTKAAERGPDYGRVDPVTGNPYFQPVSSVRSAVSSRCVSVCVPVICHGVCHDVTVYVTVYVTVCLSPRICVRLPLCAAYPSTWQGHHGARRRQNYAGG
jgi:hypothetical protein